MTEAELDKFLNDNKDAIMAASKNVIIDKITEQMKYQLPNIVGDTVAAFMKDEIGPEISAYLKDQKGPILEAAKKSAREIGDAVSKKMTEQALKSLEGYSSNSIFKALFGIL